MCVNNWFQWKFKVWTDNSAWKFLYWKLKTTHKKTPSLPLPLIITTILQISSCHHLSCEFIKLEQIKKWGLKHDYNTNYNKCNSMCENGQVNGESRIKNGHWICILFFFKYIQFMCIAHIRSRSVTHTKKRKIRRRNW